MYRPLAGLPRNLAFAAEVKDFSLVQHAQTGSSAQHAPIKRGTGGSFPGDKAAGT